MTKVDIYLDESNGKRNLWARTADGVEYLITIFDGSGYYSDIWLRTQDEIDESNRMRNEAYQAELERFNSDSSQKKTKGSLQKLIKAIKGGE